MSQNSFCRRSSEKGNVFLIVLLGVVLFAGLSFMVSRGMQSETTSRLSNRETRLAAAEVIEYGSRIERAVNKLRRRGCSENDISFDDNQGFSKEADDDAFNYNNANAPGDFTCHVFHSSGGNVQARLPVPLKAAINVSTVSANSMHPRSFMITATKMTGHGTEAGAGGTDLVLQIGRLTQSMCVAINEELNLTLAGGNPPTDNYDCGDDIYTGSFSNCGNTVADSVADIQGQAAFCLDSGAADGVERTYFQLLIAR